jgi:glucose 1-dehydrogenase
MATGTQTALITGAGKGIGQASARAFAETGYAIAVGDVDAAGGHSTVDALREDGHDAIFVEMDVAASEQIERAVSAALDRYGRIDVLVNNAGIQTDRPFLQLPEEEWDDVLGVNLTGPFLTAQRVANAMVERDVAGRIVNVSSVHQSLPRPNKAHYDASKGGIRMLTRDMALELAEHRINVNAVAPGAVATPMNAHLLEDEAERAAVTDLIPWDRFAEPAEVADTIRYLGHDAPDYVTGTTLWVDGGLSLAGLG